MVTHIFHQSALVSHTFNPSTREVETERDMAGKERNIRWEEIGDPGIQSEVL